MKFVLKLLTIGRQKFSLENMHSFTSYKFKLIENGYMQIIFLAKFFDYITYVYKKINEREVSSQFLTLI